MVEDKDINVALAFAGAFCIAGDSEGGNDK